MRPAHATRSASKQIDVPVDVAPMNPRRSKAGKTHLCCEMHITVWPDRCILLARGMEPILRALASGGGEKGNRVVRPGVTAANRES
jgi:hypothetical protein